MDGFKWLLDNLEGAFIRIITIILVLFLGLVGAIGFIIYLLCTR